MLTEQRHTRPFDVLRLSGLTPVGVLTESLIETLCRPWPGPSAVGGDVVAAATAAVRAADDPLGDADLQLALAIMYELHYRGFADLDDRWEWRPELLAARSVVEDALEQALRRAVAARLPPDTLPADVPGALARLVEEWPAPRLSSYLAARATRAEWREFLIHRSVYHLREADPHTWAIPRLAGAAKAALVEIQADEYGGGRPDWMHATLFGDAMAGLGLDRRYGRYLDHVPAATLCWANTMSLFGLHRRLRGAIVGHLAALEMTSSLPNRRYGNGLRRLGFEESTTRFFDEHVEADAVHEQIAAHDLAGGLALSAPELVEDILFGAAAALATDARVSELMLSSWAAGRSSLRSQPAALHAAAG